MVFDRLERVHVDNTRRVVGGGGGGCAPTGLVILGAAYDVDLSLDDNALEPAMVHELACASTLLWAEAEPSA